MFIIGEIGAISNFRNHEEVDPSLFLFDDDHFLGEALRLYSKGETSKLSPNFVIPREKIRHFQFCEERGEIHEGA